MLAFGTHPLRFKGRLAEAQRNADAVSELALFMDSDGVRRIAMTMRAAIEVLNGDLYAAVRHAEQGAVESGRDDPPSGIARLVLAEALLEIGEHDRCRAQLLDAAGDPRLPQVPFCESYAYLLLTRADLLAGELDAAARQVARAEAVAASYPTMVPRSSAAQARALVALARGDAGAAAHDAAEAIECGERLGSPLVAGRARILLGEALAAADDRQAAIAALDQAHAGLGAIGARHYQDHAARVLRKLGRAVPRSEAGGPGEGALQGLSARELEVIALVGEGKTNRQIADELYLSVRTVDRHLSRIFDKLGVSSRAAAASAFERSRQTA
jgi:ATP/maltotriose-dependent transcriptional regulator MalT